MNETGNRSSAGEQRSRGGRRSLAKLWVAVAIAIAIVATAWLTYSYRQSDAAAALAALPQVVVSRPLERRVDSRLGFLGQFSAVEQLELRAPGRRHAYRNLSNSTWGDPMRREHSYLDGLAWNEKEGAKGCADAECGASRGRYAECL